MNAMEFTRLSMNLNRAHAELNYCLSNGQFCKAVLSDVFAGVRYSSERPLMSVEEDC